MKLKESKSFESNITRIVIEVTDDEYMKANLTSADRLLLEECGSSDATIADKLLGLELLARRIEESQKGINCRLLLGRHFLSKGVR